MRKLDHATRQVLLRFADPLNQPYPASMLGDITISEVQPALGTLQRLGLVAAVPDGFVLTGAGIRERDSLRDAGWL